MQKLWKKWKKVNVIITDKTGTLTEGKPSLTQIFTENIPENETIQLAASLNKNSEHPLSQAVLDKAKASKLRMMFKSK